MYCPKIASEYSINLVFLDINFIETKHLFKK